MWKFKVMVYPTKYQLSLEKGNIGRLMPWNEGRVPFDNGEAGVWFTDLKEYDKSLTTEALATRLKMELDELVMSVPPIFGQAELNSVDETILEASEYVRDLQDGKTDITDIMYGCSLDFSNAPE